MEHHRHQRAFEWPFNEGLGSLPGTLEVPATSIRATENVAGHSLVVRRYPRVAVRLPVSFRNNDYEADGTICNLSFGGCRIDTEQAPEKGVYLTMHISLAYAEAPAIIQLGAVRWSSRTEFGVEFLILAEATQERLHRFLQTL